MDKGGTKMNETQEKYKQALEEIVSKSKECFGDEYPNIVLKIAKKALEGEIND